MITGTSPDQENIPEVCFRIKNTPFFIKINFFPTFVVIVKKLAAISFLFVFLFANTEFRQLLKLPVLVHHYLEHVELDENESLVNFLKIHYEREINHPDDIHGDHQRLPFKTADFHSAHIPVILPHTHFELPAAGERTEVQDNKIYSIEEHYSFAHLKNIWQPPRLG